VRILVIGGTGFIGTPLVEQLLAGGHEVGLLHRGARGARLPAGARSFVGDRKQLEAHAGELRAFGADVVVDVILSSGAQAEAVMSTFRGHAGRVVAVSSMDVYRACGILHRLEEGPIEPVPLTEDSPLRTRLQTYPPEQIRMLQQVFGWLDDAYDKIPAERAILGDARLPGTVLRLPMVYGPGDPLNRLLPIVKRIDDGRRALVFSAGMAQWRGPRGYVENVAAAIALAATRDAAAGRVYNVAETENRSELEWARLVAGVMGWNGRFVVVPDERAPAHLQPPGNAAQHWTADSGRIRRELGYREPVSVEEAIRRTVAWTRTHAAGGPHVFDDGAEDEVLRAETAREDA
jgi:nucleoside-diphosphate-sugar epimerase